MKKLIAKLREAEKRLETQAIKAIDVAVEQFDSALRETPGNSDSTSPESPASSRGASHSASSRGSRKAASTTPGRTRPT